MRIRKDARNRYDFDDSLFSSSGHLVLENIRSAHLFANAFNAHHSADEQISPAELYAACVVHEIMHYAVDQFVADHDPGLPARVLVDAERSLGHDDLEHALEKFVEEFPDDRVVKGAVTVSAYLDDRTDGRPNRQLTLEEMLICRLMNENPALSPFREMVRDDDIRASSRYEAVVDRFRSMDPGTPGAEAARTLFELLQEPALRSPHSLRDQLAFMAKGGWAVRLPTELVDRAVRSDDLIAEEERAMAARAAVPGPPPPPPVPEFTDQPEYEKFSPDVDWMPRVVMIAKNAFVWLDQLSKKYDRKISRLDEIPEEEIEQLAEWGFTALWLIGIWERSSASRKLKHRMGNPDAEASAYSIYDYVVSTDLGGTGAVTGLRMTCQNHGIRLCSDMVPNHTGIDSRWLSEHPDWFIQLAHPPYPSYSYTSESLSDEPGITLQVEDGYFDRSDAAVTFRRFDNRTREERFIYHGNDGTSMPWNDTAQLDFTKPEVREAVIQTILHVARQFPVIRFDAAMVLTRKHFRRLWYPPPGSGGGIPSRAEHGLSKEEFDHRMPVEFWREVVDRVAEEVPDTLLLAEAFWLLEGYFVRTLGMHRVYNSAFMHMLKDEDNAKYRTVMKNTLAFEPEVLKRYVNFMSNPDEETAFEQFGDGDKFFGVSTLLVTLPGLPMFGHGQVEGFSEKYGMEYRRAYHDELPRHHQVERFEREITPLLRKRYLFAEVSNFYLFDFELGPESVDENVFAYTNQRANERALVVYNNRFERTEGRVSSSTRLKGPSSRVSLGHALALDEGAGNMVTFKDVISRLEHVVPAAEFFRRGLRMTLNGYEHHVFVGFEVVEDDEDETLATLAERLDGRGVDKLEEARSDLRLKPVQGLLVDALTNVFSDRESSSLDPDKLWSAADRLGRSPTELTAALEDLEESIRKVAALENVGQRFKWNRSKRYKEAVAAIEKIVVVGSPVFAVLVGTRCLETLADLGVKTGHRIIGPAFERTGLVASGAAGNVEAIISLARAFAQTLKAGLGPEEELLSKILDESVFGEAFVINQYGGTTYYNKDRFEIGLNAAFCFEILLLIDAATTNEDADLDDQAIARTIADCYDVVKTMRNAHEMSDYDWTRLSKWQVASGK